MIYIPRLLSVSTDTCLCLRNRASLTVVLGQALYIVNDKNKKENVF